MRLAIKIIASIVVLCLVFIALGAGVYFWKEYLPHHESGALGTARALQSMQENYRQDHDEYADSFAKLGSLLGAQLGADEMRYRGYVYRFTEAQKDEKGRVIAYQILGQPETYKFGSRRSFLITNRGDIHYTDSHRPATTHDRLLPAPR